MISRRIHKFSLSLLFWIVAACSRSHAYKYGSTVNTNQVNPLEYGFLTDQQKEKRCDLAAEKFQATDEAGCGFNATECTCREDVSAGLKDAENIIAEDTTCQEIQERICGVLQRSKDCCTPCTGTVARLMTCSNDNPVMNDDFSGWLDTHNCTFARYCLKQGLDLADPYTEEASTSTRVIGIIVCVVFIGLVVLAGSYFFYRYGCHEGRQYRPNLWNKFAGGVNDNSPR